MQPRTLISINSTLITAGGYHNIRLYGRRCSSIIYVGIDIAKLYHYAAVISSDGIVLADPFKFTNDGDDFQMLSSELSDYARRA